MGVYHGVWESKDPIQPTGAGVVGVVCVLKVGRVTSEILYTVIAKDGVDFTVRLRETMWAIPWDNGQIGVTNYVDRHLRRQLGEEAQGLFPEILLPSVRSMHIEDGYGVSLVLHRDCLEAVREGFVLPFQTYRVDSGRQEVSTHIGEEIVTNQTLSDGFLVAFDAER